jgi:methionyl-tRNA formyltransferase
MTEQGPGIVFMGTPEFAVESLRALQNAGYNIRAVVTVPDRPAGRGRKISFSPVKMYALEHGLKLLQPKNA